MTEMKELRAESVASFPAALISGPTGLVVQYSNEIKYVLRLSQLSFYFIVSNVGN
jgi:hypothetical protein